MLDRFRYLPRALAILIVYAILFVTLATAAFLMSKPLANQLEQFARDYPRYSHQIQSGVPALQQELTKRNISIDLKNQTEDVRQNLENSTNDVVAKTGSILETFFGTLSKLIIVLFVTAYFLHSGPKFVERIIKLFPTRRHRLVRKLAKDYDRIFGSFVRGQLLISAIVAVATGLFCTVIGLPYSVIIGLIAGIAAVIPVIGALFGAFLPVIIALFTKPILAVVFLIFFIILNEVTDKLLRPVIVGRAVDLHPLVVFFGLLIGLQLAGIAGALLATPVVALIKVTVIALRNSAGYMRV